MPLHFLALELGEIKVTLHVNLCKCRNLKCWSYGQRGADTTSALSLWDLCSIWAQVTLIPFNLWRWPKPDLQSIISHSLCAHLDLLIHLPFQHCTLCRFQALIVYFVCWNGAEAQADKYGVGGHSAHLSSTSHCPNMEESWSLRHRLTGKRAWLIRRIR